MAGTSDPAPPRQTAPLPVQPAGEAPDIDLVEERVQQALHRESVRARISGVAYPLLTLIALLVLWEIVVDLFRVPIWLVPAPRQVAMMLAQKSTLLLTNGWVTTKAIILGYLLSILVGVPLALAIFLWPAFARSFYPLLVSSQAVPKTAIAPLFVIWLGFGILPKVLIAFLIAFFAIVISTVVGLGSIEPEKIYLARSMGMSPTMTFFKIRLPQALPSIFGGLKVAMTLAVVGTVVGEFVGSDSGLGYLLLIANGNLDTPLLFAGFVGLTVIGGTLYLLIEAAERLAIPWHTSQRAAAAQESL
jgi:NitT/TauT family transport system permease protein